MRYGCSPQVAEPSRHPALGSPQQNMYSVHDGPAYAAVLGQ